jgi:hypothetical protein
MRTRCRYLYLGELACQKCLHLDPQLEAPDEQPFSPPGAPWKRDGSRNGQRRPQVEHANHGTDQSVQVTVTQIPLTKRAGLIASLGTDPATSPRSGALSQRGNRPA